MASVASIDLTQHHGLAGDDGRLAGSEVLDHGGGIERLTVVEADAGTHLDVPDGVVGVGRERLG
jgi:hypothetical protein